MGIVSGTFPSQFLLLYICVSGRSQNGSEECLNLWIHEKIVQFRQSSQNAGLRSAEFLGQFFSDSAFNLLGNFVIYSLVIPETDMLCDWLFLGCSIPQ